MQYALAEMGPRRSLPTLLKLNHVGGFDCPSCAWPDSNRAYRKTAEFCENGAKAVVWEATRRRADGRSSRHTRWPSCETLRGCGVRVHYFGQLLAETLEIREGRTFVLDRVCTPEMLGPALVAPLRQLFEDLDGATMAEYLVGGVLKADLHPRRAHSLRWDMLAADDFVLPPLPNHLFPRDNSCGSTAGCQSTRWPSPPGSRPRDSA